MVSIKPSGRARCSASSSEIVQLLLGGQAAEQQQPDDLFKHKAVIAVSLIHDLVDVHAAVNQTARNGNDMPLLILL